MDAIEQRIRECAYLLWEAEGRQEGRELAYWERARLLVETGQEQATSKAEAHAPPERAAKAAKKGGKKNGKKVGKNGQEPGAEPKPTRMAASKPVQRSGSRPSLTASAATSE